MATNLQQALTALGGMGERGNEVPRLTMKLGVVDSIDTEGRVTVRIGDPGDSPAIYPNLDTVGVVSVGETVYWLQDFSGTGLVLGSNANGPIVALPEFVSQPTPPEPGRITLWLDTDDNLFYAWDGVEWVMVGGMAGDFLALVITVTAIQAAIDNGTDLADLPTATVPFDTDTLTFLVTQGDGLNEALGSDVLDWLATYSTATQLDTNEPENGRIEIGLDYPSDPEFWPPILQWLETIRYYASPSASGAGYGTDYPTHIEGPSFGTYGDGSSTPFDFGGYFIDNVYGDHRFGFGPLHYNTPNNDRIGDYTLRLGDGSTGLVGDWATRTRVTSTFNRTVTIPLLTSSTTVGSWFEVENLGSGLVTVSCAGSGTLVYAGSEASGTSIILPSKSPCRFEQVSLSVWRVHGVHYNTGGLGRISMGPDPATEFWPPLLGWKNTVRFWSYAGNPSSLGTAHPVRIMGPNVDTYGDGTSSPNVLAGYFISEDGTRHRFAWAAQPYIQTTYANHNANYTLDTGSGQTHISGDWGCRVRSTSASGVTYTVPETHTEVGTIGAWLEIERAGAGSLTVSFASSGTCLLPDGSTVSSFGVDHPGVVRLERTGAWTWVARGDVTGADSGTGDALSTDLYDFEYLNMRGAIATIDSTPYREMYYGDSLLELGGMNESVSLANNRWNSPISSPYVGAYISPGSFWWGFASGTSDGSHLLHRGISGYAEDLASGDSVEITVDGLCFEFHWVGKTGAGPLDLLIDSTVVHTVPASGAQTNGYWLSTPATGVGTHTVGMTATGGTGATIDGVYIYWRDPDSGYQPWNMGHSGYATQDFLDNPDVIAKLVDVDPDLFVWEFMTNDPSVATYRDNTTEALAAVRAALPNCDITILVPHQSVAHPLIAEMVAAARTIALTEGYGFIDGYTGMPRADYTGSYPTCDPYEITIDGVHLSTKGGRMWSNIVRGALSAKMELHRPRTESLPQVWGRDDVNTYIWEMHDYDGTPESDGFQLRVSGEENPAVKLSFAYIPSLSMGDGTNPPDVGLYRIAGNWSILDAEMYSTVPPTTDDSFTNKAYVDSIAASGYSPTLPTTWTGSTYQWRMRDFNGVDASDGFGLRIVGNAYNSINMAFAYIPGLAMGDGANPTDVLLCRVGVGIFSIIDAQMKSTATPNSADSFTRRGYVDARTIRSITGSTDTLQLVDENNATLVFNRTTAITETIPLNATIAFDVGTWIPFVNINTGTVTFSPASSGVTITGPLTIPNGGSGWLHKIGTNTWHIGADYPAHPFVAKTGTYTATTADEIITGDATGGAFSITLPTAVGIPGRQYNIKRINSGANAVTVATTSSQTIDGVTTWPLTAQYQSITVVSDGANWLII